MLRCIKGRARALLRKRASLEPAWPLYPERRAQIAKKGAVVRSAQALILAGKQVWFNRYGEALDSAVFPWAAQGLDLPVPQPVP